MTFKNDICARRQNNRKTNPDITQVLQPARSLQATASLGPPLSSAPDSTDSAFGPHCPRSSAWSHHLPGKSGFWKDLLDLNVSMGTSGIPLPRSTYPLDNPMIFSPIGLCFSAKLATRNQDVCLFSLGPYEVPTTYLMTSLPLLVVVTSGSVPRRPTRVRRAS